VRVRIKITATSLLFEGGETETQTQALESSLFGITTATQKLDES
jgi:hypothetical protein